MECLSTIAKGLATDIKTKIQNEINAAIENINNNIQLLATKEELSEYAKKSDVETYDDTEIKTSISNFQSDLEALTARIQALESAPKNEEPAGENTEP